MTVEYLLLLISIFLIIRELFPETDRFNPRLRKITYIALVGLLFILSIINIYNTNTENEDLIGTAKKTLKRTEELNEGLEDNLRLVEASSDTITKIKLVLHSIKDTISNQVIALHDVIKTSKEFTELKQKEFNSAKPKISVPSANTNIEIDSLGNISRVDIAFYNSGKRNAVNVQCLSNVFYFKGAKEELKILDIYSNDPYKWYDVEDIEPFEIKGIPNNIKSKIRAHTEMFKQNQTGMAIITSFKYEGEFDSQKKETFYVICQDFLNNQFQYNTSVHPLLLRKIKDYYYKKGIHDYPYND